MYKRIALLATALLVSRVTLADSSLPPMLSFESDTLSTSGYRGCFPGRTLYDINPQPNTQYFSQDNNGITVSLDVTTHGDVNEIHCPGPLETQDSITIMASFVSNEGPRMAELSMPYRNMPYPQIKSLILTKDNTLTITQESEYFVSGYKLHVKDVANFTIAKAENAVVDLNIPLRDDDKMQITASGTPAITVGFVRQGESVDVYFPERLVGIAEVYVNGIYYSELPDSVVVDNVDEGDVITLSSQDGPLLSAIYREGDDTLTLDVESTTQALCYFCDPGTSVTENVKQVIRDAMEDNNGLLGESTRTAEKVGEYESLMQALLNQNERRMQWYYGEGDVANFAQLGLTVKTDLNGEVVIVNNTTLPISYAVSGELVEGVDVCDTYAKPFDIIRPSSDFITRTLQGWSGLNTKPVKIATNKQQIEVITAGENDNVYPRMGVEDFVAENPQCTNYQPIRDMLESTARASYFLSVADDLVGAIMKTRFKPDVKSAENMAEVLKAVRNHVEAQIVNNDKTFVDDAEAMEFTFVHMAAAMDTVKGRVCKNLHGMSEVACQKPLADTAQILRSLDVEKGVDGKTLAVGLAANVVNDMINYYPHAMFVRTSIDAYQKVRDNFVLDELFFVQIPKAEQRISGISQGVLDVTDNTTIDVYGSNMKNLEFYVEQEGQRVSAYKRNYRSHSQELNNVVGVTVRPSGFVAGKPARLVAINSLGNEMTLPNDGWIDTFDGLEHPIKFNMSANGIYVKTRSSRSWGKADIRLFYQDHLLWQHDGLQAYRSLMRIRAEGKRSYSIDGKTVIHYSPEGKNHQSKVYFHSYVPGVYRVEYRLQGTDAWISYPAPFVIAGGEVDYRVCGVGKSSVRISHSITSTSLSLVNGLGRASEVNLLDLLPDKTTCVEYDNVMMWGGVFSFSQGTIHATPDGTEERSRVWTEMRVGDGEYELISSASGDGQFRTSWRPKQSHPEGPLW